MRRGIVLMRENMQIAWFAKDQITSGGGATVPQSAWCEGGYSMQFPAPVGRSRYTLYAPDPLSKRSDPGASRGSPSPPRKRAGPCHGARTRGTARCCGSVRRRHAGLLDTRRAFSDFGAGPSKRKGGRPGACQAPSLPSIGRRSLNRKISMPERYLRRDRLTRAWPRQDQRRV